MHGVNYSVKAFFFFLSFGENFRIFVLFGAFYFVCVVFGWGLKPPLD
ncbi:hypothetical protein N403_06520 [Helicobacter pylori FD430]|nr:hypothetical protein N403_06520 [Helicobacter pylori FD430]